MAFAAVAFAAVDVALALLRAGLLATFFVVREADFFAVEAVFDAWVRVVFALAVAVLADDVVAVVDG